MATARRATTPRCWSPLPRPAHAVRAAIAAPRPQAHQRTELQSRGRVRRLRGVCGHHHTQAEDVQVEDRGEAPDQQPAVRGRAGEVRPGDAGQQGAAAALQDAIVS